METFKKEKSYTLEGLKKIFIQERISIQAFLNEKSFFSCRETVDYLFDKYIEEIEKIQTVEEFDKLISESLRMSFDDWFQGI
mgnify:FL=1